MPMAQSNFCAKCRYDLLPEQFGRQVVHKFAPAGLRRWILEQLFGTEAMDLMISIQSAPELIERERGGKIRVKAWLRRISSICMRERLHIKGMERVRKEETHRG